MKTDRKDDVPEGSLPAVEPRQWAEQRARMSPEANGAWTNPMLEALVKGGERRTMASPERQGDGPHASLAGSMADDPERRRGGHRPPELRTA